MRVFAQINNCQQKKKKRQNKNKQTNKTKRGAPLLGLAKSILNKSFSYTCTCDFTMHIQKTKWGELLVLSATQASQLITGM